MRRRLGTTIAAAALAAAALPAAARSDDDLHPAFAYGGTGCTEPVVSVPIALDRARAAVPEGYVPRSATGDPTTADLTIAVSRCERFTLDGRPVPGRVVEDVGVLIESPDGTDGSHVYQLWHVDDVPAVAGRMAAAGVPGGEVSGLRVDGGPSGELGSAQTRVPWSVSPHMTSVDVLTPATLAAAATWWHQGPRGLVRLAYRFPSGTGRTGVGRVSAAGGSPLAHLLDGTDAQGTGLLARLEFAGSVTTERPPGGDGAPRDGAKPGRAAARLRVVVRPRRVRAGRRVRLRVRVTVRDRPARGATVRVGRRTARTGGRGMARIAVRLRRGRHAVRASRAGARPGRARVVAVGGAR